MSQQASPYYEAQRAVIGSMLIDAKGVAGMVMHRTIDEDYTGECKTLYQACRKLFRSGSVIDPVTVVHEVGDAYRKLVLDLMEETPTAANCDVYIDLLLEQSKLTKMQGLSLAWASCRSLDDAQALLAQANRIMGSRANVRILTMADGFQNFYERQQKPANLVAWGIDKLDETVKAEYGDFIILGGYPSAGKTAFSLQLAWNQARYKKVGYFSLETKPEKIIDRTVAMVCDVDFGRIKDHAMKPEDWEACENRSTTFVGRKLEIIQASGLSVLDIQALALAGQYDIIYIDYLQLIEPEDRRRMETEQVTQISKDLHNMANTTGIAICALSQLRRPEHTGRQEKAPGLHSLRQSGQIEQDADGVMLLYKEDPDFPNSRRVLKIAKNKEGESGGLAYFVFDGAHQRFRLSVVPMGKPKRQEPEYKQMKFEEIPVDTKELPF